MEVVSEPDSGGLVNCRGFGELGDEPEYDATTIFAARQLLLPVRQLFRLPALRRIEGLGRIPCLLRRDHSVMHQDAVPT